MEMPVGGFIHQGGALGHVKESEMGNLSKVNDQRVKVLIDGSQDYVKVNLWVKNGEMSPSAERVNFLAWHYLKDDLRGDPLHRYDDDYDVAAAEHYMYIRFLASRSGDPACITAPVMYAAKKLIDQMLGRLQAGQAQGGHPVLPSNPYVVAWGQRGVLDGLKDYKEANPGAPYKLGSAVESLAAFPYPQSFASKVGGYATWTGDLVPDRYK
ncbi:hypothetical protein [Dyella choica]|uniref:Uncharacterized protein n=1 Tax=Dyella choica TaxID=1927959 RepID=A0A432M9M3_9GAMM|nr:hypothetical protein [Dyella choica]RUL78903.1 hypothetical protein EKH80_03625 [Dyella choica]